MVLPVDERKSRQKAHRTARRYELIELRELERGTDEAELVKSVLGDPVANPQNYDVSALPLLIVGYDLRKIKQILVEQRKRAETTLRPIAVVGIGDVELDPVIGQLADSTLPARPTSDSLRESWNLLATLTKQIKRLNPAPQDRTLTLIQFMHTRDGEAFPIVDPGSRVAYRYPLAERILDMGTIEAQDIMADMSEHGLLDSQHIDRLFTCPGCGSYSLPVKELCPECHSTNLTAQESIHHFRCGYVAPESEFMREGHPVCPKCRGSLKHIGVEYNRPGRFVTCHDCNYWASEPELRAWCAECDAHHMPADLVPVEIQSFSLTNTAMQVARNGSWNPGEIAPKERFLAIEETWEEGSSVIKESPVGGSELIDLAMELAKQTDKPMILSRAVLLLPAGKLNEEEVSQLKEDAREILSAYMRDTDLVVDVGDSEFLLLMQDREVNGRKRPSLRDVEKQVRRKLGIRIQITQVPQNSDERIRAER